MNRTMFCAAALGFALSASAPASAQMAAALGKPLPVSSMEQGTATVRVIAGSPDKALVGIDVQLVTADGATLTARTDDEGRATFKNLKAGTQYTAKAKEPAEQTGSGEAHEGVSDPFQMPATGGIRMMLSTRPWAGPGGPAAGGAGPMVGAMDPRQMSGIPRGDPAVPAGTMTVAIVTENVATRISDHTVHLVGYDADGNVTVETQQTDKDGRAKFDHLKTLTHAYYVLTTFERGHGRGTDRVMSDPITMPPRVGVRLLLAGTAKKDMLKPPVEDLAYLANQNNRVNPGELLVQYWFRSRERAPETASLFELKADAEEPVTVATVPMAQPTPSDVTADFSTVQADPSLPAGSVAINVVAAGQQAGPIPNVSVTVEPVEPAPVDGAPDPTKDAGAAGKTPPANKPAAGQTPAAGEAPTDPSAPPPPTPRLTDAQGLAQFTDLLPGRSYKVAVTFFNYRFESSPITIPPGIPPGGGGQRIQAALAWRFTASGETRFDNLQTGKLYFVQTEYEGRMQRTRPFQIVGDRGAIVGLPMYGHPMVSFHLVGGIDDEYLGFSGEIGLINMSAMPWKPKTGGLSIPFPKGFIGGGVEEDIQDIVKVEPENGLLLRGLMSPGRMRFRAGFSLKVADGGARFDMPLPLGVFKGSIILIKNPGMQVLGVPGGMQMREREAKDGRKFFQIDNINMPGGSQLTFNVTGLPERSTAELYTRYAVGVMALILLIWAMMHVFSSRQNAQLVAAGSGAQEGEDQARLRKLDKRREDLLEQLVELESQKRRKEIAGDAYKKARNKLRGKLETVYADIEKLESGSKSGSDLRPTSRASR